MFRIYCIVGISLVAILTIRLISAAQPTIDVREQMQEEAEEPEEHDEIETDRDSFTPAATLVGQRRLVLESAYSFIDNRRVPDTHSLPEVVARYGISEMIELRFGYNYEVGGAGSPVSGNIPDDLEDEPELEREARFLYGAKVWFSEQDDWLAQSSVILQGFTPTRGEAIDTQLSTTYVVGWTLPNDWVWDSGIRYSTGSLEEDRFNVWSPSTVVKVPLGEKWKAHAEYFGVFSEGRARESTQHFFSPGIHYLVTRNLEIGVRVGWGLNDQSPQFFSNLGGGVRF